MNIGGGRTPVELEQQARAAVAVLYSPSSPTAQRSGANQWLVGLADEPAAWEVGLSLVGADEHAGNEGFFGASMLHAKLARGAAPLSAEQCAAMLDALLPRYGSALAAASGAAAAARQAGGAAAAATAAPRALANELRAACALLVARLPGRAAALLAAPSFGALPPVALLGLLRGLAARAEEELKAAAAAEAPQAATAAAGALITADAAAVLPALQGMAGQALGAAAAALGGGDGGAAAQTANDDLADDAVAVATQALLAMAGWCALPPASASLGGLAALPYFPALRQLATARHGALTAAALGLLAAAATVEAAAEAKREEEAEAQAEAAAFAVEMGRAAAAPADAALPAHTAEADAAEVQVLQVVVEAASVAAAAAAAAAAAGVAEAGLTSPLPELDAELCLAGLAGALLSRQPVAARLLQRGGAALAPTVQALCWLTRHPRLAVAERLLAARPWDPLLSLAGGMSVEGVAGGEEQPGLKLAGPASLASFVADAALRRAMYPFAPTVLVPLASADSDEDDEDGEGGEGGGGEGGGGVLGGAWDDAEERAAPWEAGGGYVVERQEWERFREHFARELLEACAAAGEGAAAAAGAPSGARRKPGRWSASPAAAAGALTTYLGRVAARLEQLLGGGAPAAGLWREVEVQLFALRCAADQLQLCLAHAECEVRKAAAGGGSGAAAAAAAAAGIVAPGGAELARCFQAIAQLDSASAGAAAGASARRPHEHPAVLQAAALAIGACSSWLGCSAQLGGGGGAALQGTLTFLAALLRLPRGRADGVHAAAVAIARLTQHAGCRERVAASTPMLAALVELANGCVPTMAEAQAGAASAAATTASLLRAGAAPALRRESRERVFEAAARALVAAPVVAQTAAEAEWRALVQRLFGPLSQLLGAWVGTALQAGQAPRFAGAVAAAFDLYGAAVVLFTPCANGLPPTARDASGGRLPRGPAGVEHAVLPLVRQVWEPSWARAMGSAELLGAGRASDSLARFLASALRAGGRGMAPLLGGAVPSVVAAFEAGAAGGGAWLPGCFRMATTLLQTFGPLVGSGTADDAAATAALLEQLVAHIGARSAAAVGSSGGGVGLVVAYLQLVHTGYGSASAVLLSAGCRGVLGHALGVAVGCVGGEGKPIDGGGGGGGGGFCACPAGAERHRDAQRLALALLGAAARAARVDKRPRGFGGGGGAATASAAPAEHERKETHSAVLLDGVRGAGGDAAVPAGYLVLRAVLRGLADTLSLESVPRSADVLAPLLHLGESGLSGGQW